MIVLDTEGGVVDHPDESAGYLVEESVDVTHVWVVDSEETGHWEVVAEYPNGGRDQEWVVDSEETGHWETRFADTGEAVELYDGEKPPDHVARDEPLGGSWKFLRYVAYTEEELEEIAARSEDARIAAETSSQTMAAVRMMVMPMSVNLTDTQALEIPLLFDEWTLDTSYKKDQIIRHDGELYRIGQDHTSQAQWVPGETGTTALYSHIEISEEGYEVWKEWDGVSGIYKQDQIVQDPFDNNNLYRSKIPNNVWGPPHEQSTYWDPYTE